MSKSRLGKGRRIDAQGRSKGERFLKLDHWMVKSTAFRNLSGNAVKVLLAIWGRYNGSNNGSISLGVREVAAAPGSVEDAAGDGIGISKDNVSRALKELQAAGFLVVTADSTFDQKRMAREWRLTWLAIGEQPATKDFLRQTAAPKSEHSRARATDSRARATMTTKQQRPNASTVAPVRLSAQGSTPLQSRPCDTSISYQGGSGATGRSGDPDADASPVALSDAVATIIERARPVGSTGRDETAPESPSPAAPRRRASPEPERCASTVDIEQYIASTTSAPPPLDLRQRYTEWLARQPKGTEGRVGAIVGLSRPQLANFRGGRFGLSVGPAEKLARLIERDCIEDAA